LESFEVFLCSSWGPYSIVEYHTYIWLSVLHCNKNLFSVHSCDLLPNSQYIFPSYYLSCLRLVYICFVQYSLQSKYSPKYLALSTCGILGPFCVTDRHASLRVVNVTDFILVGFHSPSFKPFLDVMETFL